MNDQTRLDEADLLRMTIISLQRQLAERDKLICDRDATIFALKVQAKYANPPELLDVQPDGTLVRIPPPPTAPEGT